MKLVLFDFDGTVIKSDSLIDFIVYSCGWTATLLGFFRLSPHFMRYSLGRLSAGAMKEKLLGYHFKGKSIEELTALGDSFCKDVLPGKLRKEMVEELRRHKQEGNKVCVVTASCNIWIQPFCDTYGIDCISTELEFRDSTFTGKFSTPNCNLEEKPRRVKLLYVLSDYAGVIAYGNSKADLPLFSIANETHMV